MDSMATTRRMSRAPHGPSARDIANQNVLASLRAAQLVSPVVQSPALEQKTSLPAELINLILDYLPMRDLFVFARTSRRMQEMVYDDTRWVQRLKSIGVWNEAEARQRAKEDAVARPTHTRSRSYNWLARHDSRKPSQILFDIAVEQRRSISTLHDPILAPEAGFDTPTIISTGNIPVHSDVDSVPSLLTRIRSIRGFARKEYAKIYVSLAPYYFDIGHCEKPSQLKLSQVYTEPDQKSQMLAQLNRFSKSDYSDGCHLRQQQLGSVIGAFEDSMLTQLEQALHVPDDQASIRKYATALLDLNGGMSAVDTFVRHNSVVRNKNTFGSPLDCIRNAFAGHVNLAPAEQYFAQLVVAVDEQVRLIEQVFPPSVDALTPFLHQIMGQVIGEYVTTLLNEARQQNAQSYLQTCPAIFSHALNFTVSLEAPEVLKTDISAIANPVLFKLLGSHIDVYLDQELDFFKRESERQVDNWEKRLKEQEDSTESFFRSNISRQAAKQDFLSSFKKMVMLPVSAVGSLTGTSSASRSTSSLKKSVYLNGPDTLVRSHFTQSITKSKHVAPSSSGQDLPTSELAAKTAIMNTRLEGIKTLFSIEIALNLVHSAKASLERARLFVQVGNQTGAKARRQCEEIFVALLQFLGHRHIKRGFDKAIDHLISYDARQIAEHGSKAVVEPLETFLELVNVGDLIQQMIDVFYMQELAAANLCNTHDFLSPVAKEKRCFEQMLDDRVAAGLNKGIDVLMNEVEYICATVQVSGDFNPLAGPDGRIIMTEIGPTRAAQEVVHVVSRYVEMLVGSTDKTVLDVFNQEVGLRLFNVICKHIKRQRISVDGAIRLISDSNHYYEYIRSIKQSPVIDYFNALRELSQIYLISTAHAREIGGILADQDRYRGIFTPEEMYEFSARRVDWFLIKKDVEKTMYGMGCVLM